MKILSHIAFIIIIVWISFVGIVRNPNIGKIIEVKTIEYADWKEYRILTDRSLRITVDHYRGSSYTNPAKTNVVVNGTNGVYLYKSRFILMQLPDSISTNPFIGSMKPRLQTLKEI